MQKTKQKIKKIEDKKISCSGQCLIVVAYEID